MRRYGGLLLILLLLFGAVEPAFTGPNNDSKRSSNREKRHQINRKLKQVRSQISEVRKELRENKAQVSAVSQRLEAIETKLDTTRNRLKHTNLRLSQARRDQSKIQRRLEASQRELENRRSLLARRIRAGFVKGEVSKVSVLMGSRSVRELLSRSDTLRRVSAADNKLYAEVRSITERLAADKRRQDATVRRIATLKAMREQETANLRQATVEKEAALRDLRQEQRQILAQLNQLEADSRGLEMRLRAFYSSPRYRVRPPTRFAGNLAIPGGPITSGFGYRNHPIARVRKLHAGIDIGLPHGAPITAAADGEVVIAGSMRGYGLTVVIDHGGEVSTLYAHCSALLVSTGQRVSRGQVIARVGSTGYSTGPHLHFEVRVNGRPVNPLAYR